MYKKMARMKKMHIPGGYLGSATYINKGMINLYKLSLKFSNKGEIK
jgi:hypothetical protein